MFGSTPPLRSKGLRGTNGSEGCEGEQGVVRGTLYQVLGSSLPLWKQRGDGGMGVRGKGGKGYIIYTKCSGPQYLFGGKGHEESEG